MSRGRALITGASSGIGAALAEHFASNGYDLVITARRGQALEQVRDRIGSTVDIDIIICDLASSEGPADLVSAIENKDIQIDILVNNAGIATSGKFEAFSQDQVDNLLSLNISALTYLTRHYLTSMLQRGSGRILNVASVAAFQPVPSMGIYAASKAFVLSLTESLSEELRGTGVSVTALCPGLTNTEMIDSLQAQEVPPFMMSSAADVAKEGFDATMAKEVIRIPGMANQAAVTWAQHQPRWLVRGLGGLFSRFKPTGN
jgi:short-subunit dehydrogenase